MSQDTSFNGARDDGHDVIDSHVNFDPEGGAAGAAPAAEVRLDPCVEESMSAVDLTTLSDEQVRDLESGNPEQISRALNVHEGEAPTRISLKAIADPEERRALAEATRMVRDGKYPNLKAALMETLGLGRVSEGEQEGREGVIRDEGVLEGRISVLEEQRRVAKAEFAYDEADELLEQITELRLNLRDAQSLADQQSYQVQEWVQVEDVSRNRAIELYPELSDPGSEFYLLAEDEIVLAEHKKDAIFSSPDWPEKIADRVSSKYGRKFGGGYAEPDGNRASSRIPSPPPRGVRMPGSPVGPAANTAAVTARSALAQLSQLSLEEQDAVLALLDINERSRTKPSQ
jgi:hypothetical protein